MSAAMIERGVKRLVGATLLLTAACGDGGPAQSSQPGDVVAAGTAAMRVIAAGSGASGTVAPPPAAAAGSSSATPISTAAANVAAGSGAPAGAPAPGAAGSSAAPAAGSGGSGPAAGSGGRASLAAGTGGAGRVGEAGSAAGSGGSVSAPGAITVWIAGDSTAANGETPCPVGWGADFQSHFGSDVKVENSAVGRRSVRTWLYNVQTQMDASGECELAKDSSGKPTVQARWQRMLDDMHAGDYLLIQFGINDSSPTCDRHVGLDAFKQSYGVMAMAAKQRGAQPVFLTPVSALSCQGDSAQGTRGGYVTATLDAGKQLDVPVIDLHARSVKLYDMLGLCPVPGGGDVSASTGGKTGAFFCEDHTHFERSGAQQIGELIVEALRDQHIALSERLRP